MKRLSLAACLVVGVLLAAYCRQAEAGILESVQNALKDAWGAVWTAVTGLAQTVECQAVDWAQVTLAPCMYASDDDLCTAECRSNLEKLLAAGQPCIDRMMANVAKVGNATVTERWEEQLTACNITFTPPNAAMAGFGGSLLLPLAVAAASMALVELLHP